MCSLIAFLFLAECHASKNSLLFPWGALFNNSNIVKVKVVYCLLRVFGQEGVPIEGGNGSGVLSIVWYTNMTPFSFVLLLGLHENALYSLFIYWHLSFYEWRVTPFGRCKNFSPMINKAHNFSSRKVLHYGATGNIFGQNPPPPPPPQKSQMIHPFKATTCEMF